MKTNSHPGCPGWVFFISLFTKVFFANLTNYVSISMLLYILWPYRLTARTTGFQSVNQGSIPCRATSFSRYVCYNFLMPILFLTPNFILIILFTITLFVYWILTFIILYHLVRFGIGTQPKKIAAIFLLGSIGLFATGALFLSSIDFESTKTALIHLVASLTSNIYPK